MINKDYNYWQKEQYYPICNKCGCRISSTRYCSKSCWINQRKQKKQTFEDIFNDIIIEKKEDFIYKNECDILQIEPPIEETKIKKSYRKLILQCHPDKPNGSNDKFIELQTAYKTLIDVC
jgi:hypothetical protein